MPHVYILHFSEKVANHAQHYCGYCMNGTADRLATHLSGNGARLVAAAVKMDLKVELVYEEYLSNWKKARERESHLKREKNLRRHCPVCIKENHASRPD